MLEIHEYEVLVSLPFNMRGSVAATDVSDHMTRQLETEAEKLDTEEVRYILKLSFFDTYLKGISQSVVNKDFSNRGVTCSKIVSQKY